MSVIKTYGKDGEQNGVVIPLWHVDTGPKIDQVYMTTVLPGKMKGPHLHMKRRGLFYCVRGEATLVIRIGHNYHPFRLTPGTSMHVAPGTPAALYNRGSEEAVLLNMPSPPWREDDKDEHEVKDWDWKL